MDILHQKLDIYIYNAGKWKNQWEKFKKFKKSDVAPKILDGLIGFPATCASLLSDVGENRVGQSKANLL